MTKQKIFKKIIRTTLVLVYLVVIAGATVRMTGSGMGCPDWPKCFGYYIPPTQESELLWAENRAFEKGQVIIKDEKLWVAKEDFTTTDTYNPNHWEAYTKHDYAIFNPYHTWVEYINRLFGALSGLACLVLFLYSFRFWKENKAYILYAGIILFLLGFNAWLGATVVYSVLNPIRITLHMFAALLTIAALILLYHRVSKKENRPFIHTQMFRLSWIVLVLFLVQILMGTQVRQHIDALVKEGIILPELWLNNPDVLFYIHRSFSIVLLLVTAYFWYQNKKCNWNNRFVNYVMLLLVLETFSGIVMAYLHFPFSSQAIHLVFATLLFGYQFHVALQLKSQHS